MIPPSTSSPAGEPVAMCYNPAASTEVEHRRVTEATCSTLLTVLHCTFTYPTNIQFSLGWIETSQRHMKSMPIIIGWLREGSTKNLCSTSTPSKFRTNTAEDYTLIIWLFAILTSYWAFKGSNYIPATNRSLQKEWLAPESIKQFICCSPHTAGANNNKPQL